MKKCLPLSAACLVLAASVFAGPPPTEKKPVTDSYHGVTVADDYRWLEEGDSPAVKAWTAAQNQFTRAYLDALPDRASAEAQLTAWYAKKTPSYGYLVARPSRIFSLKTQPPKQQPLLVTLASADDLASEKVVLDPNALEPKGQVSIDWLTPSTDGKLVGVCLSNFGSEEGTLHIYRAETGEELPDRIERVQFPTGGGAIAWAPDGASLFYTRYPAKGEKPEEDLHFFQQVWRHVLGTPQSADTYSLGQDFPRIAEIEFSNSRSGRWLLANVANGDGGEFAQYVLDLQSERSEWREIAGFKDGVKAAGFGCDDATLYLRSVKNAPRGQILKMPLAGATLAEAKVVVPQSEAVIEAFTPSPTHLYVDELLGGPSRMREFDLEGGHAREVVGGGVASVGSALALRDTPGDDRLLFHQQSYLEPSAWYAYAPGVEPRKTALVSTSPVDFSDIEAVREFAVSKDGTKVPLTILHRKGLKMDGSNPTLLTGYGGYGISLRPYHDMTNRLWFDYGGMYAIANLRGGGEYGEEWHLAGNLTRKQNVFDDFAACAEHLIARGYTRPRELAVEGGSNGGLLMGAFLTQHPELARAVVSHVGIYDMLRVELDPNGAFNVTEFGTVKDPAQFKALYAYSPFHHVAPGVQYPAVFLLAGENDGRVNPANSRKMTAALQSATSSDHPILVKLSASAGHGMGTALKERIAEDADVFAFMFQELGMKKAAGP